MTIFPCISLVIYGELELPSKGNALFKYFENPFGAVVVV
jgi:hypothetical protein